MLHGAILLFERHKEEVRQQGEEGEGGK